MLTPGRQMHGCRPRACPVGLTPAAGSAYVCLWRRHPATRRQEWKPTMTARRRYRKKADQFVVAVRLDLDTPGFAYRKWGAEQHCKAGDWLIDNQGEIYTVDHASFIGSYRRTGPGTFVKTTPIWAEKTDRPGSIATKEGRSHYEAGDYLVSNNEDGTDAYCIAAAAFNAMYEADE